MRISSTIVSALVAAGSLSLAAQQAIENAQTAAPALDLLPQLTQDDSAQTEAASAETSAPADVVQATEQTPAQIGQPTATQTPSMDSSQAPATADSEPATSEPAEPATSEPAEPAPAPAPTAKTVTSDVITYKYGVVQISLTAVGTDVTNVTLLQGDASYGRDVVYTALIDATVQTDGINYGNASGATFTTDAFKNAVTNALGKL